MTDVDTSFARSVPLENCDESSIKRISDTLADNPNFVPIIYKQLLVRRQEGEVCISIAKLAQTN